MKRILMSVALAFVSLAGCTTETPKYVDMRVDSLEPTGSAGSGVLRVQDCAQLREVRMYDGGKLVAVGKRVATPPYLCQFVWQRP